MGFEMVFLLVLTVMSLISFTLSTLIVTYNFIWIGCSGIDTPPSLRFRSIVKFGISSIVSGTICIFLLIIIQ